LIVIGLMSGTSADGVDAAVMDIQGRPPGLRANLLAHRHQPFSEELRAEIFACFRPETGSVDRICRLNFTLGRAFGAAALAVLDAAGMQPRDASLVGSHGQTLWHQPGGVEASTLQVGEAGVIAEMTGLPVISNFRARDMAAGGQGAPLVAYVDWLLYSHASKIRAVQNIGGIANVTYLPGLQAGGEAFAFDTGPGNMLMDDATLRATAGEWQYDHDGALANQGTTNQAWLGELLSNPYFALPPPKTTGREIFGSQFAAAAWQRGVEVGLSPQDIVATLTALTAASIEGAYRIFLPRFPDEVIVSGGGASNHTLMDMLRQRLAPARVMSSREVGMPEAAKEAASFAVLAYETWHSRPSNLPSVTGAVHAVILGDITPAALPGGQRSGSFTEESNPNSAKIDRCSTLEMLQIMNNEDSRVAGAVRLELDAIARAIDAIAERMQQGGRLVYAGAGTSGRLGALDASEIPPTFGITVNEVQFLIAGGQPALTQAIEGAEDDEAAGGRDVAGLEISAVDTVVGISASGRTPYVMGALAEARVRRALTISLAVNRPSALEDLADISIAPLVGAEILNGSTRLKAGTAQKMVLNMLSTGVMIRLGKTFGNWMVDMQPTNQKLKARARHMVAQVCSVSEGESAAMLERCGYQVKTTILALLAKLDPEEARLKLAATGGFIRKALDG